ncbi:MAG: glycosyltransferase family 39 protein [Candidatus Omnitrophica bacterium]|nr:glycosyltransferase family 39 protein [Candidatus Omnitrophota bacterium]
MRRYLKWDNFILTGIFAIGFYLGICNIDHGLPYIYNHDGLNFVEQALRYGKGTLEPFGFVHGSFLSYILFFEYAIYFLINLIIGRMIQPIDLLQEYILNPTLFFMIGRLTVVFFSMGNLFLVYVIGRKFFSGKTGLVAALFTCVSFYAVFLSHSIKGDIIAGFFILCSFYFVLKALEDRGHFKSLYISALLIGIAISVKYYSFIGIFLILSMLLFKVKDGEISFRIFLKLFLQSIFIVVFIFLILNPYVLIDFKTFINQMFDLKGTHSIAYDSYSRSSWYWSALLFLKEGVGPLIFYLYLLSLFAIFSKRRILLCNLYPIPLYAFLCFFKGALPNFLVSTIPFIAISAAFLMVGVINYFVKNKNLYHAVIFFTAILFSLSSLIVSWKYCKLLEGEDTRTIAKRWIESNIKSNSSILVEGAYTFNITAGGPPLRENVYTLKKELDEIKKTGASGFLWENKLKFVALQEAPAYELYKTVVIFPENIERYDPEYVVLSDYCKPGARLQSNITKEYLKKREYVRIKKILPDVYINFFPSFESLYFDAFKTIDKIDFMSLDTLNSYGPAIEIYEKPGLDF